MRRFLLTQNLITGSHGRELEGAVVLGVDVRGGDGLAPDGGEGLRDVRGEVVAVLVGAVHGVHDDPEEVSGGEDAAHQRRGIELVEPADQALIDVGEQAVDQLDATLGHGGLVEVLPGGDEGEQPVLLGTRDGLHLHALDPAADDGGLLLRGGDGTALLQAAVGVAQLGEGRHVIDGGTTANERQDRLGLIEVGEPELVREVHGPRRLLFGHLGHWLAPLCLGYPLTVSRRTTTPCWIKRKAGATSNTRFPHPLVRTTTVREREIPLPLEQEDVSEAQASVGLEDVSVRWRCALARAVAVGPPPKGRWGSLE